MQISRFSLADCRLRGGQPFKIVALDGMPLGFTSETMTFAEEDHVLLPPGGRVEAIVTGPRANANIALRTQCVDTGAAGDWNPEMILANITPERRGRAIPFPVWLDTVNVPVQGYFDVIMDFTDPVIRGMSVFHCHLLNHEDKGMMAKVLFQ
jgi:FtsP/CotA-like multicopper oxidase with cupredoxin domain